MAGNGLELGQGIHNSKMSNWLGNYGVLWRFKLIIYALVNIYVIGLALLVAGTKLQFSFESIPTSTSRCTTITAGTFILTGFVACR